MGAQLLVNESAVLVKLVVDARHGNFHTAYLGADDTKNLSQVRLCRRTSASRVRGAQRRHRLSFQHTGGAWAGGPVQGVLELAGDRAVVTRAWQSTPHLRS